jgi:hypothetical protein
VVDEPANGSQVVRGSGGVVAGVVGCATKVFFFFTVCFIGTLSKYSLDDTIITAVCNYSIRAVPVRKQHLNITTFSYVRFVGYKSSYIVLVVVTSHSQANKRNKQQHPVRRLCPLRTHDSRHHLATSGQPSTK